MPGIPVQLYGCANAVDVSRIGQMTVGAYAYDEVVALTLDVAGTGYNFFKPRVGFRFVITGILLTADKNVSTDALVDVYEGTTETDTVIGKGILHAEILKNGTRDITGLNILVGEGKWVNGKTDDDDIFVTIMGYYIPAEE